MPTPDFPIDPQEAIDRLVAMQAEVRRLVIASRDRTDLHTVDKSTDADTIYAIDAIVDPAIEAMCEDWGKTTPLILIAEGITDEHGREAPKAFPLGSDPAEAKIRVIIDPIDGTRGLMYDKRPAWALAGVAPNKGDDTCLRDIFAAVMTELPTSKMGKADVLTAIRGRGTVGHRIDLSTGGREPITPRASTAETINHGFASVSNFFPGTKKLASELMEAIVAATIGEADVTRATVFDDQYISTGGQWYELIMGRDRFNADLRPAFYRMQNQGEGLCCHPYDCACLLVAEEAGAIITDETGRPLDGPLDTTTGLSWIGYANDKLRRQIEPIVQRFLAGTP